MEPPTRVGAVLMTAVLILATTTPAVVATQPVDLSVHEADATYTVTVTHNGSAVDNASVMVAPTDPANSSYSASGPTDANGTVTFDLPDNETEVNITVVFDSHEHTDTFVLSAANAADEPSWDGDGPFGQWVTSWLHDLLNGEDLNMPFGQQVSAIVTANNPGSEHRADRANPGGNGDGPPEHAGPGGDDAGDHGPPAHAGPPDDAGDEDDDDEAEDDDDTTPTPTATPDS